MAFKKKPKETVLDYQDYSKSLKTLNKYDRFYRILCYPLHGLDIQLLFLEFDKIYDNLKENSNYVNGSYIKNVRSDVDILPFDLFLAKIEESEIWPIKLVDEKSSFKLMLQIEGVFLTCNKV